MPEMTPEQVRNVFLNEIKNIRDHWLVTEKPYPVETSDLIIPYDNKDRMNGLIHSILAVIDGESAYMPQFGLFTNPHPDDANFNRKRGKDWYPMDCNISGNLHNGWSKVR